MLLLQIKMPSKQCCHFLHCLSLFKRRLSLIVRVNIALNRRTAVVDTDWHFDNLCGSHLQSQSELYHVSWWYYILWLLIWLVNKVKMSSSYNILTLWLPHRLSKMTTTQVVETSVTVNNNSPIQDYVHLDNQTQPTLQMTLGFKPFTVYPFCCYRVTKFLKEGVREGWFLMQVRGKKSQSTRGIWDFHELSSCTHVSYYFYQRGSLD